MHISEGFANQSEIFVSPLRDVGVFRWSFSILKGSRNRAYSKAQSAASAISSDLRFVCLRTEGDGLVTGIETGHKAFAAVNTEILIDDGEFLILRHEVDILEVARASSTDVLQFWNLAQLHLLRLLALLPKVKVIDVLFEGLTALSWWTLSFPPLSLKVFALGQIQGCPEASVKILYDAEVLLLDC